jgi:peptide/nickel transport system permease protein
MLGVIVRRVLWAIPLLLVVSALTFVLAAIAPGDVARSMLSTGATPEAIAELNTRLGLDRPLVEQYWAWLSGVFSGSLGNSFLSGEPVTTLLAQRLPVTLSLTVLSLVVYVLVGMIIGFASALRGGFIGRLLDGVAIAAVSIPNFWLGAIAIAVFAVSLRWFPVSGYVPIQVSPSLWLTSLALPVLVLATAGIANVALTTRGEVLATLQQDYVKALRANGIPVRRLLFTHVLRNASAPIATVIALIFVAQVGGTVVIENVFGLAGLGTLAVSATSQHDLPVVQGVVIVFTIAVVVVFLITDIVTSYLNPKVRTS